MAFMVPRADVMGGKVDAEMTTAPPPTDATAGLRRPLTSDESRWLACAARMAAEGKKVVQPLYGMAVGRVALGRGAGGDHTLEIDRACEAAMREVLEQEAPAPHLLVSEEAGIVGSVEAPWRVVVDPLDGSLNAKRGLESFCASIAVARGETLGDVAVGYVEDYTRPRCFAAAKGAGVVCAGTAPGSAGTRGVEPDRFDSRLVELVLLEAGRPDRHHFRYHHLSTLGGLGRSRDLRIRQLGSLALSLCYVATGVADILVAAVRARSVDIAAGLLILAEAGGGAALFDDRDISAQPLDLEKRSAFVAWRAGLESAEVISWARELGPRLLVDA
jgi:myo-inositol-1(or 4)-monophosphatase